MKPKSRKFGPRLTVSLTEADYARLISLAEKGDVSVSWVAHRAIDEYLDRHGAENNALKSQPAVRKGRGQLRE